VYGKEYQRKHLERIEKKLKYIESFLETAEAREGAAAFSAPVSLSSVP
jgi:hypothetical protein